MLLDRISEKHVMNRKSQPQDSFPGVLFWFIVATFIILICVVVNSIYDRKSLVKQEKAPIPAMKMVKVTPTNFTKNDNVTSGSNTLVSVKLNPVLNEHQTFLPPSDQTNNNQLK